jgi:hypothetical protein
MLMCSAPRESRVPRVESAAASAVSSVSLVSFLPACPAIQAHAVMDTVKYRTPRLQAPPNEDRARGTASHGGPGIASMGHGSRIHPPADAARGGLGLLGRRVELVPRVHGVPLTALALSLTQNHYPGKRHRGHLLS